MARREKNVSVSKSWAAHRINANTSSLRHRRIPADESSNRLLHVVSIYLLSGNWNPFIYLFVHAYNLLSSHVTLNYECSARHSSYYTDAFDLIAVHYWHPETASY